MHNRLSCWRPAIEVTVLQVTGYEVGGVAPIGHLQALPVLIDESLNRFQTVWAAAGAQHAVFPVETVKLVEITSGRMAALAEEILTR